MKYEVFSNLLNAVNRLVMVEAFGRVTPFKNEALLFKEAVEKLENDIIQSKNNVDSIAVTNMFLIALRYEINNEVFGIIPIGARLVSDIEDYVLDKEIQNLAKPIDIKPLLDRLPPSNEIHTMCMDTMGMEELTGTLFVTLLHVCGGTDGLIKHLTSTVANIENLITEEKEECE